jgi:histidine triad (HIT) family protein
VETTVSQAVPAAYDPNNIFAKILRGEMPCHKVYEDTDTFAFMDIMPRADGHCLVIPKTAARNLLDATPAQLAACLATVQKVGQAAMVAFAADGLTIQQFNESAGGQVVFHLHYHVLPRHTGVSLKPHSGQMEKPDVLAAHAETMRVALATA